MSRDIPAIGPTGLIRTPSAKSAGPLDAVAPSRALVPVNGAETRTASGSPLERSGLDLLDVLTAGDSLVARQSAAPVATELGLEQARGALIRQQPGDALAALDAIWESARHSEEGWYLRTGALLVLGLPGEGERVAQDGIDARPGSNALRFVQSLARLAAGDVAGARASLQAALNRLPSDPLLLVQQAVLQATQGDGVGAEASLKAAQRRVPADHPALVFGRDAVRTALRTVSADRARQGARAGSATPIDIPRGALGATPRETPRATPYVTPRATPNSTPPAPAMAIDASERAAASETHAERDAVSPVDARERAPDVAVDPVSDAIRRLGARTKTLDGASLAREIRTLIRAFSTGGTLGSSGRPEQAHAARVLLGVMASVVSGDPCDAPPARRALVSAVLHALRSGHPDDVQRAMRRTGSSDSVTTLLRVLVDGALGKPRAEPRADSRVDARMDTRVEVPGDAAGASSVESSVDPSLDPTHDTAIEHPDDVFPGVASRSREDEEPVVRTLRADSAPIQDDERGVVVPLRLGLRLIDETPASRAASQPRADVASYPRTLEAGRAGVHFDPQSTAVPLGLGWAAQAGLTPEPASAGWAAAASVNHVNGVTGRAGEGRRLEEAAERDAPGADVRVAAVACILISVVAGSLGWTAVAVAFGIGAAWLAMRRSR